MALNNQDCKKKDKIKLLLCNEESYLSNQDLLSVVVRLVKYLNADSNIISCLHGNQRSQARIFLRLHRTDFALNNLLTQYSFMLGNILSASIYEITPNDFRSQVIASHLQVLGAKRSQY